MAAAGALPAYKRHIISEFLKDRSPYLEDITGHLKAADVSTAFGDRLFPRLVEQLKSPGMAPEKLVEALRTICDLCSHQENKCQAISSDVIAAATHLLMHENVPVRRDAARVISSLSLLIGGRSQLPVGSSELSTKLTGAVGAGPTLPRLAKLLLSCDDELVKLHVAEAMHAITIFRDGCQQVVDQGTVKGVTQYLCATLPDLPSSSSLSLCLLNLLQTLAAVTMYARDGMRDLFGTGLLAKIVGFLGRVPKTGLPHVTPEKSTDTIRQALRLLWHCGNNPTGRLETLKADGVRVITEYLSDGDAKVREAAVCALNVVSLETQGKRDVLEHSLQEVSRIIHSDAETTYLQETCVQLCRCASELPAFRFAFARHVLKSVWLLEKVYGTAALAAISPLLGTQEDLETRVQACAVAMHFLQSQTPGLGDDIRVPPLCPLSHIDEPPSFAFEECVDIIHNLVDLLIAAEKPAQECLKALTSHTKPREELAKLLRTRLVIPPSGHEAFVNSLLQNPEEASGA
ncbi:unnamed protein product [Polarella glacialis]|uniref:Armadillo repeat-containing protein 8 n=1 Tax=Polarella glacialis TaxID=89957 RepID=A0A813DGN8_POLGL|nr:unnamed protein product [Polarella glacialis]CAE8714478.1 unnamed protein product [Polarella glacialis]